MGWLYWAEVGGIEAEAAMLGQPISMLIPEVVGFKLSGELTEGTTGTDLVLKIVEMLREKGVVGKFVEFYGDGLDKLPLADRATIANMAPNMEQLVGFSQSITKLCDTFETLAETKSGFYWSKLTLKQIIYGELKIIILFTLIHLNLT